MFLALAYLHLGNERRFIEIQRSALLGRTYACDYDDLVAAGRVVRHHIIVYEHEDVRRDSLTTSRIFLCEADVENTFYLLRVADGRYHALERKPDKRAKEDAVANTMDVDGQTEHKNSTCMETRSQKKSRLVLQCFLAFVFILLFSCNYVFVFYPLSSLIFQSLFFYLLFHTFFWKACFYYAKVKQEKVNHEIIHCSTKLPCRCVTYFSCIFIPIVYNLRHSNL